MLDFDKIDEYSDYKVMVRNTKTGEVIAGLLDNEGFSYSTVAILGGGAIAGEIEDFTKGVASRAAGDLAGKATGGKLGGFASGFVNQNYKTIASTFKGYTSAGDSPINLQIHVFARSNSYNYLLNILHKFTQPNTENDVLIKSYLYDPIDTASLLTLDDPFKGQLLHVSIGEWFFATGMMCTGVDFAFSKYIDEENKPIYLQVNIGLVPYKLLNAKELSSWVRK
jgi:hypothetical protein